MTLFNKDIDKVLARVARHQSEHEPLAALVQAIQDEQRKTQQTKQQSPNPTSSETSI